MRKSNFNLIDIVEILNDGNFHDGSKMGKDLNLTRAAIWKSVKKLKEYGISFEVSTSKGYKLSEPLQLLDIRKIRKLITDQNIPIDILESINSTNAYLKPFKNDNNSPKICLAEYQEIGKGRLGRNWHSPFGQNIYFSLLYNFKKDISELSGLSLIIGLTIVKTLENYGKNFQVKWPNDVIYENAKLAGTLIEMQAEANGSCQAIIGIGINVNMIKDDKNVDQLWISLRKITNQYIDRNSLIAAFINNLLIYIKKFEDYGLKAFIDEWKNYDALYNKKIDLKNLNSQISGIVKGINEQGNLMLELENGDIKSFASGDTTIMK